MRRDPECLAGTLRLGRERLRLASRWLNGWTGTTGGVSFFFSVLFCFAFSYEDVQGYSHGSGFGNHSMSLRTHATSSSLCPWEPVHLPDHDWQWVGNRAEEEGLVSVGTADGFQNLDNEPLVTR